MVQQGQVFRLTSQGAEGHLWAYRHRTGGARIEAHPARRFCKPKRMRGKRLSAHWRGFGERMVRREC